MGTQAQGLSDHDFAKAVRELTKSETNDDALEVLRAADQKLAEETPATDQTRSVDPSRLPAE